MGINIRRAVSSADFARLGRLRYDILVSEVRIHVPAINHEDRTVLDALDDWGEVLIAENIATGEVLGSARINLASEGDIEPYATLLGMTRFGSYFPSRCALLSRLVVAPRHRRLVTWPMLEILFTRMIQLKAAFCFSECRPDRLRWAVRHLGYRQVFPDFHDAVDGRRHPLVLVLGDVEHLQAIGSPLRRLVDCKDEEAVRFFKEHVSRGTLEGVSATQLHRS